MLKVNTESPCASCGLGMPLHSVSRALSRLVRSVGKAIVKEKSRVKSMPNNLMGLKCAIVRWEEECFWRRW